MENQTDSKQPASSPSGPTFNIQRLYVKEQTGKLPYAPGLFKEEWKPEINMEMRVSQSPMEEHVYEVTLQLSITAKNNQRTAFTIEVQQAGLFELKGFSSEQLTQLLNAYCPSILYPYARKVVADLTVEASLPPLTLAPVNFEGLYQEQTRQKETASAPAASSDAPSAH